MSTQAPEPDGHRPDGGEGDNHGSPPTDGTASASQSPYGAGRPSGPDPRDPYTQDAYRQDPYTQNTYEQTPYGQKPYAGDAFGPKGPSAEAYPGGTAGPGGYPQAPYTQGGYPPASYPRDLSGPGAHGQQGYAPGPYGQPYAPQKSRVVAGVLGILLGAFGVHRLYLGFTTVGVIQILMSTVLVFFTFGLSAIAASIWGLVEGIMILVGAQQFQRDAHGVPLRD